jgi:hypothetical protein
MSPSPQPPDPSTPDPAPRDPATPDPATPDPATPDRGTPDPGAPDLAPPDPATPDPATPDPATFVSGDAGDVTDPWRRAKRTAGELAFSAIDTLTGTRRRATRLARDTPRRDVLVIGVYRTGSLMPTSLPALHSETHNVRIALGSTGAAEDSLREHTVAENLSGGKFENLNRVLATAPGSDPSAIADNAGEQPAHRGPSDTSSSIGPQSDRTPPSSPRFPGEFAETGPDWLLVVDDDVRLPSAFLDRFVAVCEAFRLDLAQPAQTLRSHSAWKVTRRRPASLVRETRFVEIGPVTAFGRQAAAELLPFPELRYGWGLDLHWAALAGQRGWRLGVVDALPVRHESSLVGAAYSREDAQSEAAHFLADRPYLPSVRANEVLAVHRRARG